MKENVIRFSSAFLLSEFAAELAAANYKRNKCNDFCWALFWCLSGFMLKIYCKLQKRGAIISITDQTVV